MQTVNLEAKKFDELFRCFSILKDICSDVDIRGGVIRQRTDDNASIFEIDMRDLLGEVDIPIIDLKSKLDLIKCFSKQDVIFEITDDEYSVSDQFSRIQIKKPSSNYIDNSFITEEDLNNIFTISPEDQMLSTEITKRISGRIKVTSSTFDVNTIQVRFDGSTASLSAETHSRDQKAKFLENIPVNTEMMCESNLIITPFIIDHDGDISFTMYQADDNVAVNCFKTSISDIRITVYGRSILTEEVDDA